MSEFKYEVYLNDELIEENEKQGIAYLKYESAKLVGKAELRYVYIGSNYDPVLHNTKIYDDTVGGWKDYDNDKRN